MSYSYEHKESRAVRRSIAAETDQFRHKLASAGISSEGRDWALLALDPFHDSQLEVVGKCDSQIGRSIVFDIRTTTSVSKDPSLAAGNWDCHIAFIPTCRMGESSGKTSVFRPVNGVAPPVPNEFDAAEDTGTRLPDGVVVACQNLSGLDTFDPDSSAVRYDALSIDEFLQPNGRHSVVAAAVEVHNTTAEINKQGSVTCYRFENRAMPGSYSLPGSPALPLFARTINAPPRTLELAKKMGGVTWDASAGVLLPLAFSNADAAPGGFTPAVSVIVQDNGFLFANNNRSARTADPCGLDLHMDSSGAYFAGLSEETTLTVTLRMCLEVFPPPSSDLMSLAKMSPPLDFEAMQLVSRIQATLKPGYPVSENGFGDFFRGIAGTLGKVLKPIAKGVGYVVPGAKAITNPIGDLAAEMIKLNKKKKKKK